MATLTIDVFPGFPNSSPQLRKSRSDRSFRPLAAGEPSRL